MLTWQFTSARIFPRCIPKGISFLVTWQLRCGFQWADTWQTNHDIPTPTTHYDNSKKNRGFFALLRTFGTLGAVRNL